MLALGERLLKRMQILALIDHYGTSTVEDDADVVGGRWGRRESLNVEGCVGS